MIEVSVLPQLSCAHAAGLLLKPEIPVRQGIHFLYCLRRMSIQLVRGHQRQPVVAGAGDGGMIGLLLLLALAGEVDVGSRHDFSGQCHHISVLPDLDGVTWFVGFVQNIHFLTGEFRSELKASVVQANCPGAQINAACFFDH